MSVNEPPEHCPGTESENAGKASACAGCPNQSVCAEGPKGPDPGIQQVKERLSQVENKILVLSGKGGVGKSTVTALLGRWLAHAYPEKNVAILDIDICGPSQPRLMGVSGEQVHQSGSGWSPVYVDDNLSVMSLGFLLASQDDAVIWRGPRKNAIIRNFLADVDWGATHFLLIDTPPGTSDEHLSAVTYLSEAGVTGAVVVTTPQEVALLDVRKEIDFCRRVRVPVLGVVENMASFVCPTCRGSSTIFPASTGGARKMCEDLGVDFLGGLPMDARVTRCCDEGRDCMAELKGTPAVEAVASVAEKLVEACEKRKSGGV